MSKQLPEYCKVFKKLDISGSHYGCVLIRDEEVERYNVCKDSLKTFGTIDKTTIKEMGWSSREEFIKNRLKDHECVDLLKVYKDRHTF